ncbi:MAG: filamentous hemagglutinin N-terminal domain-containing protein, partial [Pirellulaceae bacterium]|nr:filamentous hemagglutinin N-terminal domain-containing protein [Pirellulaceae bacterium]
PLACETIPSLKPHTSKFENSLVPLHGPIRKSIQGKPCCQTSFLVEQPVSMTNRARSVSPVVLMATCLSCAIVPANPIDTNPNVVSGQVAFEDLQTSNASILQQSQQAIVDYNRFNLPEGSSVNFIQPNADAAILNRITGADPSFLNGTINANGQVYFVNPAGVTFGPDSVVRADMFMAIAGDMANSSFLRGEMNFLLGGTVENQGYIEAQRGVALLGRQVRNTGQIVAENGFAVLASGEEVLLQPNGTSLAVQVTDSRGQDPAGGIGVENLGEVNGEEIMFSAGDAFATAIRHEGSARAGRSARVHSEGGRIEVSGEILAGNQSGGGRIEVGGTDQGGEGAPAASSVRVADSAVLDASAPGAGDGGHVVVWSGGQTE